MHSNVDILWKHARDFLCWIQWIGKLYIVVFVLLLSQLIN